ncbi:MAG: DUF885 domain-containing protein [Myxococcales bacterium]
MKSVPAATLCLAVAGACANVSEPALRKDRAAYQDRVFQRFVDRYYKGYFDFRPGEATDEGFHDRDGKMPDLSRGAIGAEAQRLRGALAELDGLDPGQLDDADRVDRGLLRSAIRAELLDLTEIRSWQRQPSYYNDRVAWSIFALVKRDFAPLAERMADVIAREQAVPGLLSAAEANLEHPPRLWVEVAIEDASGTLSFLTQDVPAAFATVEDAGLQARLRAATGRAAAAYQGYLAFLKDDLLPRADGDFRLGETLYRRKLAYEEGIELPIDRLLEIGEAELAREEANLVSTARQIDPDRGPAEVLAKLTADHPAADQVIPRTQALLASLRDFCEQHHVVGIPSELLPTVAETPPFARAFTFASMDTPGPFEEKATQAYFYETLPSKGWSPQRVEEHLEAYWSGDISNTAIHEAYPGHYVQFLWLPKSPTKVRKLVSADSFIEGWAHYGEEMLLEEGYGGDDPKLWISQEQWALVRACRYLVALRMHTRGLSLDDAVAFFEKHAYLNHANALREAQRGTADPTYLVYTLGKLEILKLRRDYQRKLGPAYSLQGFHDALLSLGAPPIPVARELLLGEAGEPL